MRADDDAIDVGVHEPQETTPSSGPAGGRGRRDWDLIVIGSGGAAFAAAIRARELGQRVLMVEHGATGGTCLNVGCIPSKVLLSRSERARLAGEPALDEALVTKGELIERLRQMKYIDLLGEYAIAFRSGHARLTGPHTVSVDGDDVTARAILLAVGARPAVPAIPGLREAGFVDSGSAMEFREPPRRLAVLGIGPVGLELGQMLGNFGSRVTFIGRRGVLPSAEPEISAALRGVLEADGHDVLAPAVTASVTAEGGENVVRGSVASEPFEVAVDEILVATGRTPNTDGLGLDEVGVELDGWGAVLVDGEQRTTVPSVYAAGDVTTQPRFIYVAAAAGAAVAENAFGAAGQSVDLSALPQIVFTSPAVAQAGPTEAEALERGLDVDCTVMPLDVVARALVEGDTRGVIKLVREVGTGRLVGASILAAGAPDVIQSAVLAIQYGITVEALTRTWAPYLTMAEGFKLAAQSFDRDVTKLSCCT
jgi:mercuric reductase